MMSWPGLLRSRSPPSWPVAPIRTIFIKAAPSRRTPIQLFHVTGPYPTRKTIKPLEPSHLSDYVANHQLPGRRSPNRCLALLVNAEKVGSRGPSDLAEILSDCRVPDLRKRVLIQRQVERLLWKFL